MFTHTQCGTSLYRLMIFVSLRTNTDYDSCFCSVSTLHVYSIVDTQHSNIGLLPHNDAF